MHGKVQWKYLVFWRTDLTFLRSSRALYNLAEDGTSRVHCAVSSNETKSAIFIM